MPYLKGKYNQKENKESVQIFRGINAMRRMFLSLLKDARKNEEYVFIGGQQHELAKELNIKLFDMVNGILDKNKVKARGIAHKSSQIHRNKTWIFNNMKFVSFSIPTFTVFRNKVIIYDWAEVDNALAFVITSEKIAEQYKNLFKEMWKIAKK